MRGPTHSLGAVAGWLAGSALLHPTPAAIVLGSVAAGLAAPWPDIDNLGAWRRSGHPVKRRVSWAVSLLGSHRRGPTHSLIGGLTVAACLTVPLAWWPAWPLWLPLAVLTGWWSHLLLDLANKRPLRLFWPSCRLVYGLPGWLRCRVGGFGEGAWSVALVLLLTASVWKLTR